jgi:hypothetical protein
MSLLGLFQTSRTITLAIKVVGLLHKGYLLVKKNKMVANQVDGFISKQLEKVLPTATTAELLNLIKAGRAFVQACWDLLH